MDMENEDRVPVQYPERLLAPMLNFHLAMDVALGVDEQTILDAYDLQAHEFRAVKQSAIFNKQLDNLKEQLAETGGSFKLKAMAQAEALLAESFRMAVDPEMDPKVRADMIKSNVRWAGQDAPAQKGLGEGGGFHLTMNFNGEKPSSVTYDQEDNPA